MESTITNDKLEKLIFKYLDNKNFVIIETDDDYYFFYNEDDEYSIIRFRKNDKYLFVYYNFLEEIQLFFSLEKKGAKDVIIKYVENTLNIQVCIFMLKIP